MPIIYAVATAQAVEGLVVGDITGPARHDNQIPTGPVTRGSIDGPYLARTLTGPEK